jgi:hypothetical protein
MAPVGAAGLSAARAQFAGPTGMKGLTANGKTSAIAAFAALGGFVYGYNQGMFGQVSKIPHSRAVTGIVSELD